MSIRHGQLSRISIAGYKSIKKCSLELNSINVLIGSNGSGKSNFISAFTLLQSVLRKELRLYTQQSGVNSLFFNGRTATDEIYFEAFFDNNS